MSEGEPFYPQIPHPGHRFVDDAGYGFVWGLAGSSIFRLFGGLFRRGGLAGAARAIVSTGTPRAAGAVAAYYALCSASGAAMDLARPNKDDLWNTTAAWAGAWAALGLRRGAAGAALVGAGLATTLLDGRIATILETPPQQQSQPLHAPAANGFSGFPQGPPIVVQEVPVVGDQRL